VILLAEYTFLDLCCGFGGWSIGFHRAGFECTGVDILDIAYPYELILQDIRTFHAGKRFNVVASSPPCTEWSALLRLSVSRGQRGPGDVELGKELVRACVRVIEEIRPTFWILENVRGGVPYISEILGKPKMHRGPWYLWGNFPQFLIPESDMRKFDGTVDAKAIRHDKLNRVLAFNPLRSWFRSKIPLPLSVSLAKACKEALDRGES
jgi:hypothetical protein